MRAHKHIVIIDRKVEFANNKKDVHLKIREMNKYRSIWMGIAMLWVVIFHYGFAFNNTYLDFIKKIGYGGVDIFIFAAGIGSYHSYLRDENPLEYIKRRINRLAPVYVPFIIVWLTSHLIFSEGYLSGVVGNLLGIQGFSISGIEFNWYLTGIIICYVLTPYLAPIVKNSNAKSFAILIVFLVLVSTVFWNDQNFIISATRLPIYCIGMYFAKKEDQLISKGMTVAGGVSFVVGACWLVLSYKYLETYLWSYGLHWYPFILMTPFMCFVISFIASKLVDIKALKWINNLLRTIGEYSFEIYLSHIYMMEMLTSIRVRLGIEFDSIMKYNIYWIVILLSNIPVVIVLRIVSKQIRKLLNKRKPVEAC